MEICSSYNCTGCATCVQTCTHNAITMQENKEGFLYPVVNDARCVNCKLCIDTCPSNNTVDRNYDQESKVYSFISPNKTVRINSSSGGMFYELAQTVLEKEGAVYGAMIGSKYVESVVGDVYQEVKEDLMNSRMVLFTGLPCQIAGLYAFLKESAKSEYLLTADLLCHGVPSLGLFRSYIRYLQSIYNNICDYTFRDKTKWGWGSWGSFSYEKNGVRKKKYFLPATDYYYGLYYKENCLRESCYRCKYCKIPRVGDITIGDYWGIENYKKESEVRNGVSLVMVNNIHAEQFLFNVGLQTIMEERRLSEALELNRSIVEPAHRPPSRDAFYYDYNRNGFIDAAKKYVVIKRVTPILARYVPKRIKLYLKKFH